MSDTEAGIIERLRYSAEAYYIRGRGWLRLGVRGTGLALVVLGGILLFAQTGALAQTGELGTTAITEIIQVLDAVAIPVDVSWLYYIVAGLVLTLLSGL